VWIIDGILAGLIAGVIMGCISQLGYRLGILKSHLIVIDGEFALRKIQIKSSKQAVYSAGMIIHLVTSIVFGIIYVIIARLADFEVRSVWAISLYFLALWLAMLTVALPISGQGFMGRKIHTLVWLEQLVLHIIFAASFWWGLGIA
jgi:uncharacterized membrane protein YagU involved in acid resistance